MLGPTVNAVLGIIFFVVGTAATLLMFHCWGYPYDKKNHKSSAPESLVFIHRLLGYIYLGIYIYLMIQMVPRMWTYQVELPARTVVHLSCGFLIGCILFIKLSIVRFFKILEGPLVPGLGIAMWLCTCLLLFLSIPFTVRESYLNAQALPESAARAENLERVGQLLQNVGLDDDSLLAELTSTAGLSRGRQVMMEKCTTCHDLRTVLAKNRTASSWKSTVSRMAAQSDLLTPINEDEEWQVTAYLIAISPELVKTAKQKRKASKSNLEAQDTLEKIESKQSGQPPSDPEDEQEQQTAEFAAPENYSAPVALLTYERICSECHGLDEVENYDFVDFASIQDTMTRMTQKPGFEANETEIKFLLYFLSQKFLK